MNTRYLVADNAVACGDLLIGRPVLPYLLVDMRTFLEDRVVTLDGTDCSLETLPRTRGGRVSRLILKSINRVGTDEM